MVTDELTGDEWTIESLAPGVSENFTAEYTVTEADILKGKVVNEATATGKGSDDKEPEVVPGTTEDPTDNPSSLLTITKNTTSTPANGQTYALGEKITYKITATNDGNLTLTNVVVTDELTGDEWTIESLVPGASETFTAEYTVTEADILEGKVVNEATATGNGPEDHDPEIKPGDTEDPTDDPNPSLTVSKSVTSVPASGEKYVLGETISYAVTITNNGNQTLTDINVQDVITRPDGSTTIPSGWESNVQKIESLAPGKEVTITYDHVVTEADLGGELKNAVTVSAPDPENPEEGPKGDSETTVITDDPENCSITVTKTNTSMLDEAIVLSGAQFHVALFSDEALTQRVGDVQTLTFGENAATATAAFNKIKRGTYYVAETDEDGNVVTSGEYNNGAFVPQYPNGNKVEITENGAAASFGFNNQFLILPSEYDIAKDLIITKNVLNSKGKAVKSTETFYAGIFADADYTQLADNVDLNIVPLAMGGESSVSTIVKVALTQGAESVTLYVTEVTADGTPVSRAADFGYEMEISSTAVTVTQDADGSVTITNKSKVDEDETECEEQTEDSANTQTEKSGTVAKSVKTGDDTPILPLAIMFFCSAAVLIVLVEKRRRRQEQ